MKSHFISQRILILQNLVSFQIGMKPKFPHFPWKRKPLGSLYFWQAAGEGRVLETLSFSPQGFPWNCQDCDQGAWKPQGLPLSWGAARLQAGDSVHRSPAVCTVSSGDLSAAALALLPLLCVWVGPVCCICLLHGSGFPNAFPKCRPSPSIPLWELRPWDPVL